MLAIYALAALAVLHRRQRDVDCVTRMADRINVLYAADLIGAGHRMSRADPVA
jgi:hypothetical protein